MKRRFEKLLSIILIAALLLTVPGFCVCAAPGEALELRPSTEITVRASEIKSKGCFKAIQLALNSARYGATKDNNYKITVEPGSYELRSALHIYSNTTLVLEQVTLTRNSEAVANMIRTGDDTAPNKGGTGYDVNANIKIVGGTLDGGGTSNTMVKVTHARDFSMTGTELRNIRNAHMMEVAAVDGFVIQNCFFKNHRLDVNEVGYETIQLDVAKDGHIIGCRSEALPIRNVSITGSRFENCPRGIGSHTQILNVPFENILISDNTFTNMSSAAIQAENWKNCQIINNRIDNTPRGISVYALLGDGSCGFKPSVLAKEGGVSTDASDRYQKPFNANILIAHNTITNCGKKDIYANYDPMAISLIGTKLVKTGKTFSDGAGGYPKGDYYITGVTVSYNDIQASGYGIYLDNVRNIRVDDNSISCSANSRVKKAVNPLTSLTTVFASVSGNTVSASPFNGFELASSTVSKISDNSVTNVAQDGILLEAKTKVTGGIDGNFITKAGRYGINVRPNCAAGNVTENVLVNCAKGTVRTEKKATAKLGKNYYKIEPMSSLTLNEESLVLGSGETFNLAYSYAPVNALAKFTWKSSDPGVAAVSSGGVVTAHRYGDAEITLTSVSGKTATCRVTVKSAPQSIKLNERMLTIGCGEAVKLESTLSDDSASYDLVYLSNNTDAVTVDSETGILTGAGNGSATVIAKTYNGKHAGCNVIVRDAPYDIWFDNRELSLGVGEVTSLGLILPEGSASHSIVFASDNPDAVSVDQNGGLSANAEGEAVVTATAFNGAVAICRVTVKGEPGDAWFAQKKYTVGIGESLTPEVVFPENTASHALSFQSSDPDICRVNRATGELTPKKAGTVTITVKTYNHIAATCKVVVKG